MTDAASSFPEHPVNTEGGSTVLPSVQKKKNQAQEIQRLSCPTAADHSPIHYSTPNTCNESRHNSKRLRAGTSPNNQNQVLDEDQGSEVKGTNLMFRCKPRDLLETIKLLSTAQVDEICKLRWGDFLKIKIDAIESRDLYCWLLDHVDTFSMKVDISPDKQLPISAASVNTVLGVPLGGGELSRVKMKHVTAARNLLRKQLGIVGYKITIKRLKEEVAKGRADELSMKCFFMIAFNKMLFPTASYDVSNTEIMLTMDLNQIATVDWCKVVVQDIRGAAAAWHNRDQKFANTSLHGCAPYLLIYYLDQLDHELNNCDRISTPRAAFFDKHKVEHITLSDRFTRKVGRIVYGATQFKSPVGTCYQDIVTSMGSTRFAQAHIMLHEYTNLGVGCKQKALHELLADLDSDISGKMNLIESTQQHIISQLGLIKATQNEIMVRQRKFAKDLCQLIRDQQENSENISGNGSEPMEDIDGVDGQNGACNGEESASTMDNIGAATDQHLQRVQGVVQPGSPDGGQNDVHDLTFSTTNEDYLNCSCVPVTNGANVGPGSNDDSDDADCGVEKVIEMLVADESFNLYMHDDNGFTGL